MRTDTPTPDGSTLARLRAGFTRAGRRLADRVPSWRWADARVWRERWPFGLAAVALVAALAIVVAASTPATPASGGFVRSGEAFSADDLKVITRELGLKKLPCNVDSRGHVEVALDRLEEANEVVARLNVGQRSLWEIDNWAMEAPGLLDAPGSKELRQSEARKQQIAAMIRSFDGVAGAWVTVNRPKPKLYQQRNAQGATAFVLLDTKDDREINHRTVQRIVALIASFEPEVKADAVSVFDRKGRSYADAHNPTVSAETRARARQEGFEQEIAREIDWIAGVQVSVRLDPPAVPAPNPLPPAATTAAPVSATAGLPPLPPPRPESRPTVVVNRPLDLAADEPRDPASPTPAPPSPNPAPTPASATTDPGQGGLSPPSKARVLVKVPHSYYLKWQPPNRKLSPEDLSPLVTRTEQLIETAVRHVVPPEQLGEVKIGRIPDDSPAPVPPPATADARRAVPWWIPAAVAGASTALVTGLGFRLIAARRPALRTAARADRGRYKIDEADDDGPGPGPSERVRELIRLNPEAAASVLIRWTGQGGPVV